MAKSRYISPTRWIARLSPDLLVKSLAREGLLPESEVRVIGQAAAICGQSPCSLMLALGEIADQDIARIFAQYYEIPYVNVTRTDFDAQLLHSIGDHFCWQFRMLPLNRTGDTVAVAMADPTDEAHVEELEEAIAFAVTRVVARASELDQVLQRTWNGKTPPPLRPLTQEIAERAVEDARVLRGVTPAKPTPIPKTRRKRDSDQLIQRDFPEWLLNDSTDSRDLITPRRLPTSAPSLDHFESTKSDQERRDRKKVAKPKTAKAKPQAKKETGQAPKRKKKGQS
jgi:hypothetical protein